MSETIAAGVRVELCRTLLEAGQRAPSVPPETAAVAYEMRVRGLLTEPAEIGASATVLTATGRHIEGILERVEPADDHSFGRPHRALLEAAARIAAMKAELHD